MEARVQYKSSGFCIGGATRTALRAYRKSDSALRVQKKRTSCGCVFFMEAPPGIGPGIKVLQTSALPLGYGAILPRVESGNGYDFLLSYPSSDGADYGARTRHLDLGKVALYQMS